MFNYRSRHSDSPPPEVEAVRQRIFNAAARIYRPASSDLAVLQSVLACRSIQPNLILMQAADPKASWDSATQVILGPDPQLALYGEAVVWFHKVELFRQREEERMFRENPMDEDLRLHKELLLRLIADGEHLVRLTEQHGFLSNTQGISCADLKATLQNLKADYRGWHEPMSSDQKEQILSEVFNGAKSAH